MEIGNEKKNRPNESQHVTSKSLFDVVHKMKKNEES